MCRWVRQSSGLNGGHVYRSQPLVPVVSTSSSAQAGWRRDRRTLSASPPKSLNLSELSKANETMFKFSLSSLQQRKVDFSSFSSVQNVEQQTCCKNKNKVRVRRWKKNCGTSGEQTLAGQGKQSVLLWSYSYPPQNQRYDVEHLQRSEGPAHLVSIYPLTGRHALWPLYTPTKRIVGMCLYNHALIVSRAWMWHTFSDTKAFVELRVSYRVDSYSDI